MIGSAIAMDCIVTAASICGGPLSASWSRACRSYVSRLWRNLLEPPTLGETIIYYRPY